MVLAMLRANATGARLLTLQRMTLHSAALSGSRACGRAFPQQTLLWRGFSSAYVSNSIQQRHFCVKSSLDARRLIASWLR